MPNGFDFLRVEQFSDIATVANGNAVDGEDLHVHGSAKASAFFHIVKNRHLSYGYTEGFPMVSNDFEFPWDRLRMTVVQMVMGNDNDVGLDGDGRIPHATGEPTRLIRIRHEGLSRLIGEEEAGVGQKVDSHRSSLYRALTQR